jgi:thiaminase/transcriptional activator TenA
MKITAAMVDRAMPIWEEIMKTPFIQEMIDGTLPVEKFKNYTIQDTLYIKGFSRTYAYGFINSDDIKIMRRFYQCMHVILADESMLHIRYLKEFYGMDEEKVYELKMEPENKAYTDYMVEISKTGTAQETLAAVMPCILSYLYIAKIVKEQAEKKNTLEGSHFQLWIEEYASERYAQACEEITEFMDDISADLTDAQRERIMEIFCTSSKHELAFWTMAYRD